MKPFFGSLFDFNGDGVVTTDEEFLGYMMIQQMQEDLEEEQRKKSSGFGWLDQNDEE